MKIVIWGAGDGGLRTLTMLQKDIEVIAFIDISNEKEGTQLCGIKVYKPDILLKLEFDKIFIGNLYGDSIIETLKEYNITRDKIVDIFNNGLLDARIGTLKAIRDEIYENNIQGETAELGVYKGEFAQYINKFFPERKLFLFDTFEGFNQKDVAIEEKFGLSNAAKEEFYNDNIDLILNKMTCPENCIVKKGYFPDSAEGVEEKFCLVSLDVDLYMPTYSGLEYFYNRLSNGGYIMLHDYNSTRFNGVKKAVRKFCEEKGISITPLMDICGTAVISKPFIK